MFLHIILRKGKISVKNLGVYYGATLLDETDLVESTNGSKILLEYYGNKKHSIDKIKLRTFYGITIIKKEYKKDEIKYEENTIKRISTNESKIRNIIQILKTNKVTPVGLNDVLTELLKRPQYQGE